ncbi:MAG: hypothetical protein KDB82_04240 [Planctomycetes bacterium]|nr:hypothetical protein [Planctomycetota bacterium]
MRTRLACTLCLLALFAFSGCSSQNIIEMKEQNTTALQNTGAYTVVPLKVDFKPPVAWEIDPDEWKAWVDLWKVDFREELRTECYKTLEFVDSKEEADGAVVECTVYEMDKGGFSGFGGNGFARAHITVTDQDGKLLYDAKLEGTGANSGFESAVAEGRLKFAILNLARQIADVLENG